MPAEDSGFSAGARPTSHPEGLRRFSLPGHRPNFSVLGSAAVGALQTLQNAVIGTSVAAVLLVLVAMVMGVDFTSSRLRARIL